MTALVLYFSLALGGFICLFTLGGHYPESNLFLYCRPPDKTTPKQRPAQADQGPD